MENIDKVLDSLAARFGTTAEHVWTILVKQTFYEGISCFVASILCGVLLWFIGKTIKKIHKKDCDGDLMGVFCVLFIVLVPIMAICGFEAFHRLLNPEYYAMQEIFELIK